MRAMKGRLAALEAGASGMVIAIGPEGFDAAGACREAGINLGRLLVAVNKPGPCAVSVREVGR